jgi:hypothetical protein
MIKGKGMALARSPMFLLERYRLIVYPLQGGGWEIYDCDEALQQRDPLAREEDLYRAVVAAVKKLEEWIG